MNAKTQVSKHRVRMLADAVDHLATASERLHAIDLRTGGEGVREQLRVARQAVDEALKAAHAALRLDAEALR